MKLAFAKEAWEDYLYWQKTDTAASERIDELIGQTLREPYKGPGQPHRLSHALSSFWVRRLGIEHLMVYKVKSNTLMIAQLRCRY